MNSPFNQHGDRWKFTFSNRKYCTSSKGTCFNCYVDLSGLHHNENLTIFVAEPQFSPTMSAPKTSPRSFAPPLVEPRDADSSPHLPELDTYKQKVWGHTFSWPTKYRKSCGPKQQEIRPRPYVALYGFFQVKSLMILDAGIQKFHQNMCTNVLKIIPSTFFLSFCFWVETPYMIVKFSYYQLYGHDPKKRSCGNDQKKNEWNLVKLEIPQVGKLGLFYHQNCLLHPSRSLFFETRGNILVFLQEKMAAKLGPKKLQDQLTWHFLSAFSDLLLVIVHFMLRI